MKTNVTVSLDTELVARLDAWRAPLRCGRSHALELLLEGLPEFSPVVASEVTELVEELGEADDGPIRTDLALRGDGELIQIAAEDTLEE